MHVSAHSVIKARGCALLTRAHLMLHESQQLGDRSSSITFPRCHAATGDVSVAPSFAWGPVPVPHILFPIFCLCIPGKLAVTLHQTSVNLPLLLPVSEVSATLRSKGYMMSLCPMVGNSHCIKPPSSQTLTSSKSS